MLSSQPPAPDDVTLFETTLAEVIQAMRSRGDEARWEDIWQPQESPLGPPHPQVELMKCELPEVLYGGARGGGKTDSVLAKWMQHRERYRGAARGLFVRRRQTSLEDVILRSAELYPQTGGRYVGGGVQKWRWPDGGELRFRHLWDTKAARLYQGQAFTFMAFEEIQEWPDSAPMDLMRATLRSAKGVPCQLFATGNPGGVGHCVPHGEVLTPFGWKDIRDFAVGDPVYSVDPEGKLVETQVEQVHRHHFDGEMVHVRCRGLSMTMTPEHRVAKMGGTKQRRGGKFSLVPFERLPGQARILRSVTWGCAAFPEQITVEEAFPELRRSRVESPRSARPEDYFALVGWVLSEGSLVWSHRAFVIAQSKPEGREAIQGLLDRMGFEVSVHPAQFTVYARDWFAHFAALGLGAGCREKRIPRQMLSAPPRLLAPLFEALMDGDGHWTTRGKSGTFYTSSRGLANDVCELAVKLGKAVSASSRQRNNRIGMSYAVNFKELEASEILTGQHCYDVETTTRRRSRVERRHYRGPVYCIGVPHHAFVLRQEGSVWVSGNSWVKARYIDPHRPGFKPIEDPTTGEQRIFIPAKLEDNPALVANDPTYEQRLLAVSRNPALVRAWRYGDWEVIAGAFFSDVWNPERQILKRFMPPQSWHLLRSFDWGSAKPSSLGLWAISDGNPLPRNGAIPEEYAGRVFPKGSFIRIGELYTCERDANGIPLPNQGMRLPPSQLGELVERETEKYAPSQNWRGYADPSIFDESGGKSLYRQMTEGTQLKWLGLLPADNKREPGWQRIREMMAESSKEHPEGPGIWVMDHCEAWIRTVPALPIDERRPDDVDTDAEDHPGDETRYATNSFSGGSVQEVRF